MSTSGEKRFRCTHDGCSYATDRKFNLTVHMRTHVEQKPFKCPICEKEFTQKNNLERHLLTHETDTPRFECEICHKTFAHKESLAVHMNEHNGVEFKCEKCEYTTYDARNLKRHVKAKHKTT